MEKSDKIQEGFGAKDSVKAIQVHSQHFPTLLLSASIGLSLLSAAALVGCDREKPTHSENLDDSVAPSHSPPHNDSLRSKTQPAQPASLIMGDVDKKAVQTETSNTVSELIKEWALNVSLYQYLITLIQTITLIGITNVAIPNILDRNGISTGHPEGRSEDEDSVSPTSTFGKFSALVFQKPFVEELLFRISPSMLLDASKFSESLLANMTVGVISALIFASIHNIVQDEFNRKKLSLQSIPIQAFSMGLFLWYLMRTKGFDHAIFAHSLVNGIAFTLNHFKVPVPKLFDKK